MPPRPRRPEGRRLQLQLLPGTYAICRLASDADVGWASGDFQCVTRCTGELLPVTVITLAHAVPEAVECDAGWRVLRISGTFTFGEVGVLASVANALAQAGVPVVCTSTFETDYVLVRANRLDIARDALEAAGHAVNLDAIEAT